MDTLYAILGLVVILVLGYLLWKLPRVAAKAANRHVFLRSEHQEGQQLVSELVSFKARAAKEEVMRQLSRCVAVAPDHSAYKAVVYISSQRNDLIIYAYGNKFRAKTFEVGLSLSTNGNVTAGAFKMLNWHENSGIVEGIEEMKALRDQIGAAFEASDRAGSASKLELWVCGCGSHNDVDARFCRNCGEKNQEAAKEA